MTNRVHRFAFELFDTEPWFQLGQAPVLAPIPGPTQLDVDQRGLGNRLAVAATRNGLDVLALGFGNRLAVASSRNELTTQDTRNILDVE
jgi:hypothetical protein